VDLSHQGREKDLFTVKAKKSLIIKRTFSQPLAFIIVTSNTPHIPPMAAPAPPLLHQPKLYKRHNTYQITHLQQLFLPQRSPLAFWLHPSTDTGCCRNVNRCIPWCGRLIVR
jgi:hypothetical protein